MKKQIIIALIACSSYAAVNESYIGGKPLITELTTDDSFLVLKADGSTNPPLRRVKLLPLIEGIRRESSLSYPPSIPMNLRDATYAGGTIIGGGTNLATWGWKMIPAFDAQDIKCEFANFMINTTTFEVFPHPHEVTLKAALEVNSVIYPMYFSGKRTVVLSPGGHVMNDPLPITVKTTDDVYVRTSLTVTNGSTLPVIYKFNGGVYGVDKWTNAVDVVDSGDMVATASPTTYGFAPLAVYGNPVLTTSKGVLLLGDSIVAGSGDFPPFDTNYYTYPLGFAARASKNANVGYLKAGRGGESTTNILSIGGLHKLTLGEGSQNLICNLGINDLIAGISTNVLKTNLMTIWRYYAKKGLRVFQTTYTPRTTSTDYWLTTNNQTVTVEADEIEAMNEWFEDTSTNGAISMSGGSLYGVFNISANVTTADRKWACTNAYLITGTATSTTSTYLQDTNVSGLIPYGLGIQYVIKLTGGTGAPAVNKITMNTPANRFHVSAWTNGTPSTDTTYEIWSVPTTDGTHPTAQAIETMSQAVDTTKFK